MKKKIKVFYDGKCNVCNKEINFYSKIDKGEKFEWINIHKDTKQVKKTGITKDDLLSVFHIQEENGNFVKGVEAFKVLWGQFKYLKILSFLLKFRYINIFANSIYKIWLKKR